MSLLSIFCRDYQVYSDLIIGPKLNALVHFHFVLDLKILNSAVAIFHTKRLSSIFNWFFYQNSPIRHQNSPIWCLTGAEVSKSEQIRVHRALDGGQFRFWSNLKVPFYVHLRHISVIWDISSHILLIKKQIKFPKNEPQK